MEVFGPALREAEQFSTGPVVGFRVDDVRQARREMEALDVEFIGPVHEAGGSSPSHFFGPGGQVYEITRVPEDSPRA